ncbi:MAG TPA: sulfotransferase domain-containing protein [Luteolibacter sp.]|nr:sulfotransferase domain-containing protein [Luteolibacter sp.]
MQPLKTMPGKSPRLLMPLPEAFWGRIRLLEDEPRFIACYPRSGSRWLMMALSLMATRRLGQAASMLHEPVGERAPQPLVDALRGAVVINAHDHPYAYRRHHPRIIGPTLYRTHDLAGMLERSDHPVLYLYRQAPAVMFSYCEYSRHVRHQPHTGSLEDFCEEKFDSWVDHLECALRQRERGDGRIRLMAYQHDGPFCMEQLAMATRFLGLDFDDGECRWGYERLRQVIAQLNERPGGGWLRGSNRDIATRFPPALLARIEQRARPLLELADHYAALDGQ